MSLSGADLFTPLLDASAPRVLREIPVDGSVPEAVALKEIVFESVIPLPDSSSTARSNEVFAIVAAPTGAGPFPGILLLHGGKGHADRNGALAWAAQGYVVVAPDLPGIADIEQVPHSRGEWMELGYGENRWVVEPDITHSTIFQGVTAALQSFALLRDDPRVDATRLGVTGTSWGGYMTTMLSGLLGLRVSAAFSNYGAGFYEYTTFAQSLSAVPGVKEKWLAVLDAGRRANAISAAFFIAGAANDTFFYPPAVEKTLAAIPKESSRVHAPNAHHELPLPGGVATCGGSAAMAAPWFAWHLKGEGRPFPVVHVVTAPGDSAALGARFRVTGDESLSAICVWWSAPVDGDQWPLRVWKEVPALSHGAGLYEATLPQEALLVGTAWFALISEERGVSVSSPMQILVRDGEGLEARPLAQVVAQDSL